MPVRASFMILQDKLSVFLLPFSSQWERRDAVAFLREWRESRDALRICTLLRCLAWISKQRARREKFLYYMVNFLVFPIPFSSHWEQPRGAVFLFRMNGERRRVRAYALLCAIYREFESSERDGIIYHVIHALEWNWSVHSFSLYYWTSGGLITGFKRKIKTL